MVKYPLIRKCLVVGIILLFVGITVAPSINFNNVQASNENDLVEVTTQVCGIKGFGNTTVKFTRQQYQNLEQYLVEFRSRLNQTTTREEAVPLFKDAVVELNKYGLLPKGMSEKTAQQLVIGRTQSTGFEHLMKKPFLRNQFNLSDNENFLCLVHGIITGYTFSFGLILLLLSLFYPGITALVRMYPLILIPIDILHTITFGECQDSSSYSADGWLGTFGLNGRRVFYGQPLYGTLPLDTIGINYPWGTNYYYPGIMGFTGLHINLLETVHFYLGFALWVKIDSVPPQI
jgi:hypothetical protein